MAEKTDRRIENYWTNIETIWPVMARAWQAERGFWPLGPANYVLRTKQLWAVDPMLRQKDAAEKILPRVKQDFAGIRFVLISHLHSDHYNLAFLREISAAGVSIAVPEWIAPEDFAVLEEAGGEIIRVNAGMRLHFDEATVDVLPGWHYDFDRPEKGVPSLAFMVTEENVRYLFPGDVRDFEHCQMPQGCDVVLGHVWLGCNSALLAPEQTALARYVSFIRRLQPGHLLLTHLYDLRRKDTDLWTMDHAQWICDALRDTRMKITVPLPGERVTL